MFRIFNLHFTDLCNFHCGLCFVKKEGRELPFSDCKKVIDRIAEYFEERNIDDGRINIAGGEPLFSSYIQELIDYIHCKNIRISIITNGFLLNEEFIKKNKDVIEMIGISIDSINDQTNRILGRCQGNTVYDYNRLLENCALVKKYGVKLKINIVVSRININEDIKKLLDDAKPDRFKIFQMIPTNKFAEKTAVTKEEFLEYAHKYDGYNFVIENQSAMSDAYVIIDSHGKISTNNLHADGFDILNNKISDYEDSIGFNQDNEDMRYK